MKGVNAWTLPRFAILHKLIIIMQDNSLQHYSKLILNSATPFDVNHNIHGSLNSRSSVSERNLIYYMRIHNNINNEKGQIRKGGGRGGGGHEGKQEGREKKLYTHESRR